MLSGRPPATSGGEAGTVRAPSPRGEGRHRHGIREYLYHQGQARGSGRVPGLLSCCCNVHLVRLCMYVIVYRAPLISGDRIDWRRRKADDVWTADDE